MIYFKMDPKLFYSKRPKRAIRVPLKFQLHYTQPKNIVKIATTSVTTLATPSNTPSAGIEDTPSAVIEDNPSAVIEDTPSAVIEDNPSAVIEDTPSAVIEDTPSAVLEDTTSAVLEDTPSAVIEDTPFAVLEDTPSAVIEDTTSAVPEDTPSAVIEDTPSAVLEDTTSAVLKDTTSAVIEDTPSAVTEDTPSAVPEDTPSAVIEDTPSPVLEDTTSAVLEDTTSAVIEDTPSAVTEDTPSAVPQISGEDSPLMIILSDGHYLDGNEIVFSSIDELNSFIQHSGLVSNDVGLLDYVNVPSNGIDVSMNDADCVDVFPIDGSKSDTEHSVLSTQVTGHVDPDFFLESVVSPINAVNPNENVEVMAKRITRKGKRNIDLWKRNVRKSKHLKGEVHVNSVGVVVSAKSVKLATCKCRLKCNKNFSDNSRSMINHEYYALGDYTIILLSISLIIHCNVLVLYVDWSNFNAHCNMLMLDFNNFNARSSYFLMISHSRN